MLDSSRILSEANLREEYKPSKTTSLDDAVLKGLHYGQRKLMLSEVEILTNLDKVCNVSQKPVLVVYAGAAPGLHLPFLFELFPTVKFILIDPAVFVKELVSLAKQKDSPILELINDICTNELCLRLARMYGEDYFMLLISDIRSGCPSKMKKNSEHTLLINEDNNQQKSWCFHLKCDAALLKFHPPYPRVKDEKSPYFESEDHTPDSIEYLDGILLWGVWAPKSSSEVRLFVTDSLKSAESAKTKNYNCLEHEERCYYYNVHNRYIKDCEAEKLIFTQYLAKYPSTKWDAASLSNELSKRLGFPLFTPLADGFTEDHARWSSLLYSTKKQEFYSLFDEYKEYMTIREVRNLVTLYKSSETVPLHVKVGDKELTSTFWRAFCAGDFAECYSFPKIRWSFFNKLIKPKGKVMKRPRSDK